MFSIVLSRNIVAISTGDEYVWCVEHIPVSLAPRDTSAIYPRFSHPPCRPSCCPLPDHWYANTKGKASLGGLILLHWFSWFRFWNIGFGSCQESGSSLHQRLLKPNNEYCRSTWSILLKLFSCSFYGNSNVAKVWLARKSNFSCLAIIDAWRPAPGERRREEAGL